MLLITLVIIFAATWCGIYLSKGITVPIQKLAEGTHEVAQGNWDYKIEAGGDDEIGVLMNSFNHMTGDLKQIKLELERRGKVVRNADGKYCRRRGFDRPGRQDHDLEQGRRTVARSEGGECLGKTLRTRFFAPSRLRGIREIVDSVKGGESIEREIKLSLQEQLRTRGAERRDAARRRRLDSRRHAFSRGHHANSKSSEDGGLARGRSPYRP